MSKDERKPTVNPNRTDSPKPTSGALVTVATFAIDTGDRSAQTIFALANDVRGELRTGVDNGLDAIENAMRGLFRIGKRVTARVDELAADVTSAAERTVGTIVKGLRETTQKAGELASTASNAMVAGERPDGRAPALA